MPMNRIVRRESGLVVRGKLNNLIDSYNVFNFKETLFPTNVLFGKNEVGSISGIPHPTGAEITAGTGTGVRSFSIAEIRSIILTHSPGGSASDYTAEINGLSAAIDQHTTQIGFLSTAIDAITGGGGSGTWGGITGTLSDQSDLQSALDGKSDTGHTHSEFSFLSGELDSHQIEFTDLFTSVSNNSADWSNHTIAWGAITGTLSDQSDLQTELDGKSDTGHTHGEFPYLSGEIAGITSDLNFLSGETDINETNTNYLSSRIDSLSLSGGPPAWGAIIGTLSNQTDLQNALDAKANSDHTHTEFTFLSSEIDEHTVDIGVLSAAIDSNASNIATNTSDIATNTVELNFLSGQHDIHTLEFTDLFTSVSTNSAGWTAHAPAWGNITGTLSDQTDLQGELDGKSDTGHTHDPEDITVNSLVGATHSNLEDYLRTATSNGSISGLDITDGGSGTVDIAAGSFFIRSSDSSTAPLYFGDYAGTTGQALTDDSSNFIYISYNSGVPSLTVSTTPLADANSNVIIGIVFRDGNDVHISKVDVPTEQVSQKLGRRLALVDGVVRQSGGIVTESGTRNVAITASILWLALSNYSVAALDTSVTGSFDYYHQDGVGGWTTFAATAIDNLQYDDGSGTLATLANNRYGVHWVYTTIAGEYSVVYGEESYTLSQAENALVPASLPLQLNNLHSILLAKIIVAKNGASLLEIESAFANVFTSGLATDHGGLGGLTDDDHTQYLLADGTRALAGAWDMGNFAITNINIDSGAIDNTPIGESGASTAVFTDLTATDITVFGTVDGRDVATDGATLDSLGMTVATNVSDISDNATDIATNVTNIATNVTNIAANSVSINFLSGQHDIHELEFTDLFTSVSTNSAGWSTHAVAWGAITGTLSDQTDLQGELDGKSNTGHTHDHGTTTGLGDDDHPQYLLASGSRALAGAWSMGNFAITNINIDSGAIDGTPIGATSPSTGAFTTISLNGDDLRSDMDTMSGDIITNTQNIATNAADIITNSNSIGTNATDIATNVSDIATNQTNIATNAADIATNLATILEHTVELNFLSGQHDIHELEFNDLFTSVSTNSANWSNHTIAWGGITGTLSDQTDLQAALDVFTVELNFLSGQHDIHELEFNDLFTSVSTNSANWSNHTIAWGGITGTLADQSDLQSALDGKSDTGHTHDHGTMTGLADDDHTQYLLADGSRALGGSWNMANRAITNINVDSGALDGITIGAGTAGQATFTKITMDGGGTATVDGRDVSADGNLLDDLVARQSSYNNLYVGAGAMVPGLTATTGTVSAENHRWDFHDFTQTGEEEAYFELILPQRWDLGAIKMKVLWEPLGGSAADNVVFSIENVAIGNGDTSDATYGTPVLIGGVVETGDASTYHMTSASSSISPTASSEDLLLFKLTRKPLNGFDDLAADLRVRGVYIQYAELPPITAAW